MKGQVLYFNGIEGVIYGEDGKRYKFNFDQWKEQIEPKKGYQIDFEILNNEAIEIYLIDIPKYIFSKENESIYENNKFKKFKLASIGSLLIFLAIIINIYIIKSNNLIYHEEYFYFLSILGIIGIVLFSYALKYISSIAYKKLVIIDVVFLIALIGFMLDNPLTGIISVSFILYSLYKLQEIFKILLIETKVEYFKTIQMIFKGAFIISIIGIIISIISISLIDIPSSIFHIFMILFVGLFSLGWLLSALVFYKSSLNTEGIQK
jgi:hypothetical protein